MKHWTACLCATVLALGLVGCGAGASRAEADGPSAPAVEADLPQEAALQVLDLFEGISLGQEGISPRVSVALENASPNTFVREQVRFSLSQSKDLANGDVVTVTAEYDPGALLAAQYRVEVDTRQFTIAGADAYAGQFEQLDETLLQQVHRQAADLLSAELAAKGILEFAYDTSLFSGLLKDYAETSSFDYDYDYENVIRLGEPELFGMWFVAPKDGITDASPFNRLFCVYRMTLDGFRVRHTGYASRGPVDIPTVELFALAGVDNIVVQADGTVGADINDIRMLGRSVDMEALYTGNIAVLADKYVLQEAGI